MPTVTDPHVAAAAQFPSRRLVWHHALPSRASDCRPPTATGGRRQSISFSPAHLAPVAAIAGFILLAPPAHGYRTRSYSHPPPTWFKALLSKGLAAIPTPLEVPSSAHVLAGPSVWPQKLRSTDRASGIPRQQRAKRVCRNENMPGSKSCDDACARSRRRSRDSDG